MSRSIEVLRCAACAVVFVSSTAFGQTRLGHPLPAPTPTNTRAFPRATRPYGVATPYPVQDQGLINAAAASVIQTVPVAPGVFMLVGAGANTLVQVGNDGVLVVDSKYEEVAPRLQQEIHKLSDKPILWLINTGLSEDHIAGNQALLRLGSRDLQQIPHVVAHQDLLNRLTSTASRAEEAATIKDPYTGASKEFSFNGEAVSVYAAPSSTSAGDSLVFLHNANVLATGDVFNPDHYPVIDIENGGSVKGEINALNHILELTAADKSASATQVMPGHGRLSDAAAVREYRDMLIILRDRIQGAIKQGLTLTQIKTSGLTREYDTLYGSVTGAWTTDKFVEAVYNSLTAEPAKSTTR